MLKTNTIVSACIIDQAVKPSKLTFNVLDGAAALLTIS